MKVTKIALVVVCLLAVISSPFWVREETQADQNVPRSNVLGLWDVDLGPASRMSTNFTDCGGGTVEFPLWYPATLDYVSIKFAGDWRVNTSHSQLGEWFAKKNGAVMAQGAIYPYNEREFHLVGNPSWIAEGNTVTGYLFPNSLIPPMSQSFPEFEVTWNSGSVAPTSVRKVNLSGWGNLPYVVDLQAGNLKASNEITFTTKGNDLCAAMLRVFDREGGSAGHQSFDAYPGIVERVTFSDSGGFLGSGLIGGYGCKIQAGNTYTVETQTHPNAVAPAPAQAGLGTADPSTFHSVGITKTADGFDTALAINNPTSTTATFDVYLFSSERILQKRIQHTLPPMGSLSKFYHELLELESVQMRQVPADFVGTLIIVSDADLGVVSLITRDGLPSASLPSMSF